MAHDFKGTINVDIRDSVPDWSPFGARKGPAGAPNVVCIVLDDVGFSTMTGFPNASGVIPSENGIAVRDPGRALPGTPTMSKRPWYEALPRWETRRTRCPSSNTLPAPHSLV